MIWKNGYPHLKPVPRLMVGMLKLSQNLPCDLLEGQALHGVLSRDAYRQIMNRSIYSKSAQEDNSM